LIRDLSRLARDEFDLLVVGGGIYGLTIAYDAAQRGLKVALVERHDFGAATSFNHLKTIHGGLRYLQSLDLPRMRESVRERRAFARIAPRFVAPQAFAMPLSRSVIGSSPKANPLAMRAAMAVDALVASDRNDDVPEALRLPAGRVVSGAGCRDIFNGCVAGISAAAIWHDYVTVKSDRLTLAFAIAAADHGAALANYVEATEVRRNSQGRPTGVRATDVLGGESFDIKARSVVNAAGPWTARFLAGSGAQASWPLLKVMNLVTTRPAGRFAVVAPSPGGRALVLLPWQGIALIGTSESADPRSPDDQQARRSEVVSFLADVNAAFPELNLTLDEIALVHRGIVPADASRGTQTLQGQSRIVDRDGLVSVIGVKYTTARAVAERVVDLVLSKLGKPAAPCRTAAVLLPGAALSDSDPPDAVEHAVKHEMAHSLIDVVVRRIGAGEARYPGDTEARAYAGRMQELLGWSDERKAREITELRRFYEIEP
jgi:glycerol-3-phosphate dehydrogenase